MANDQQLQARDFWTKFRDVAVGLGAIAVPVVVAVIGNAISASLKDRDIRLRTVELAIAILQENPKDTPESPVLRNWAMTVVDAYSGVPLPDEARKELQERPIVTGGERKSYSCDTEDGSAEITVSAWVPVAVYRTPKRCLFSIAGASTETLGVQCRTVEAGAAWPPGFGAASAFETEGKCVIEFSAAQPSFEWGIWPFSRVFR